jgi:FlaA1/EpsC-like NDP-sugar epimerase
MAERLLIYGNGQMAEFAWARFRRDPRHSVVGFAVDRSLLGEGELCGLPVIPFEEVERHFPPSAVRMFVAVGPVRNNHIRADRYPQTEPGSKSQRLPGYHRPGPGDQD